MTLGVVSLNRWSALEEAVPSCISGDLLYRFEHARRSFPLKCSLRFLLWGFDGGAHGASAEGEVEEAQNEGRGLSLG